jgi:type III pantothenate kinase
MQSGAYYGYVSQVDGIIERIMQEVGHKPKVIATGGLAEHIGKASKMIEIVDSNLTIRGLNLIYHKLKNGQ